MKQKFIRDHRSFVTKILNTMIYVHIFRFTMLQVTMLLQEIIDTIKS